MYLFVWSHLTYGASVCPENAVMYSAGNKGQNICGGLPETTVFKSYSVKHERISQHANYSDLPVVSLLCLTHSEVPEGTQQLSTTFSLAQNILFVISVLFIFFCSYWMLEILMGMLDCV